MSFFRLPIMWPPIFARTAQLKYHSLTDITSVPLPPSEHVACELSLHWKNGIPLSNNHGRPVSLYFHSSSSRLSTSYRTLYSPQNRPVISLLFLFIYIQYYTVQSLCTPWISLTFFRSPFRRSRLRSTFIHRIFTNNPWHSFLCMAERRHGKTYYKSWAYRYLF